MNKEQKEIVIKMCTLYAQCAFIKKWLALNDVQKHPEDKMLKIRSSLLVDRGLKYVDELERLLKDYKELWNSKEGNKVTKEYLTQEKLTEIFKETIYLSTEEIVKQAITMELRSRGD